MAEIAGCRRGLGYLSENEIAEGIIAKAASHLRLNLEDCPNSEAKEEKIFTVYIEEWVQNIKERLRSISSDQEEDLKRILNQNLKKLSHAEREAIRKAIKTDELSGESLLRFLKTTSGIAIAQMLVGATGFGAFLFLTTSIHALGLLLGITFPFVTYTAATSTLSFLLSGPFLLLIAGLSGGFLYHQTTEGIKGELAKMLIVIGRAHNLYGIGCSRRF